MDGMAWSGGNGVGSFDHLGLGCLVIMGVPEMDVWFEEEDKTEEWTIVGPVIPFTYPLGWAEGESSGL